MNDIVVLAYKILTTDITNSYGVLGHTISCKRWDIHIVVTDQRQAIIWINAGIMFIGRLGTDIQEITFEFVVKKLAAILYRFVQYPEWRGRRFTWTMNMYDVRIVT